ncbi:MAG TPA: prepilin peptidase [candidate division Zixibacteria bacterium]|nr:prepilin peptidase [candidate division Zixibacteria bacterium]
MTASPFFPYITVFIVGAAVGSFLNVCIARIPKRESVIRPASRCLHCGKAIAFYDNIPLLSYLLLKARCRSCGKRISIRYPVVELLMASLAVALFRQFGLGLAFVASFVFVAALIVISFIDLDARIVPDVISLPGIATGLLFAIIARYLTGDPSGLVPSPISAFIGALVGGGFLLALAWAYQAVTGVEGMGGGDIKLLAMIGAFLGWPAIPLTLFFSSLGGSVVGLSLMVIKGAGRRYAMPFAPFLCLGALAYLFFGRQLIDFCLFPR